METLKREHEVAFNHDDQGAHKRARRDSSKSFPDPSLSPSSGKPIEHELDQHTTATATSLETKASPYITAALSKEDAQLDSAAQVPDPPSRAAARKRSGAVDEKQRSRRLFGALIGAATRSTDAAAKKRQEIEARRKAELERDDQERKQDKSRKNELRKERTKGAEWSIEESNMRIRHNTMRNAANFLLTKSRPQIRYRPWTLQPSEQREIELQKEEVEEQIEKDVKAFWDRRAAQDTTRKPSKDDMSRSANDTNGMHDDESIPNVPPETADADMSEKDVGAETSIQERAHAVETEETNGTTYEASEDQELNSHTAPPDPVEQPRAESKPQDLEDEQMVEGDEDNVIY